jgi:hypothetical protein
MSQTLLQLHFETQNNQLGKFRRDIPIALHINYHQHMRNQSYIASKATSDRAVTHNCRMRWFVGKFHFSHKKNSTPTATAARTQSHACVLFGG